MATAKTKLKKALKNKKVLAVGALAIGAYVLTRGGSGNDNITLNDALKPVKVGPGERVRTHFYRKLALRRPNMTYVPIESGVMGDELTLVGPKNGGTFTRNIIQGDSGLEAEFA